VTRHTRLLDAAATGVAVACYAAATAWWWASDVRANWRRRREQEERATELLKNDVESLCREAEAISGGPSYVTTSALRAVLGIKGPRIAAGADWEQRHRLRRDGSRMSTTLQTAKPPSRDPHGITPSTSVYHISEGPSWAESTWLGWTQRIEDHEYDTALGPAVYEPVPYERAGRSWSQIVVGKFLHPVSGEVVGWAWRYYR